MAVLTPKGEAISLPRGSTVVDYAYHVHTSIGDRMVMAKVNGSLVTASTRLKNGVAAKKT